MQLSDFQVGQTVFVSESMRHQTGHCDTVAKVGRKYVTLVGHRERKFFVRDERESYLVENSIYGSPALLYPSNEAYELVVERQKLEQYAHKVFDFGAMKKLSLDQLRRIKAIVEEE